MQFRCRQCPTFLVTRADLKLGICKACYRPHSGPSCKAGVCSGTHVKPIGRVH